MGGERKLIEEAFGLLNSDSYERALPLIADDFEMVTTADVASEPDVYRGPEGVRRWWDSFLEAMAEIRLEALSFDDLGDGRVIIEFLIHARGKASGIDTQQPAVTIATAADGKLKRLEFFTSLEGPGGGRAAREPAATEVVRAGIEGFAAGGVEALIERGRFGEEFELVIPPELTLEPHTYVGHDGLRRYFDSWYEVVDELRSRAARSSSSARARGD